VREAHIVVTFGRAKSAIGLVRFHTSPKSSIEQEASIE
jgi:hypothetical protein